MSEHVDAYMWIDYCQAALRFCVVDEYGYVEFLRYKFIKITET